MGCADPCWAPCGWRAGWTRPSERDRLESVTGTRGRDRPRTHGPGSRHVLRCLAPACTGPGCLSDLSRGAHRVPHPWHSGKGDLHPNLSDTALQTISPFGKTRSYERPAQVCGETRAPRGGRRRPHCRSGYFSRDDRGRQELIAEDRRAAAPRGRGRRYPGSSRRSLTAATDWRARPHLLPAPPRVPDLPSVTHAHLTSSMTGNALPAGSENSILIHRDSWGRPESPANRWEFTLPRGRTNAVSCPPPPPCRQRRTP